jgi:hypothetical protein
MSGGFHFRYGQTGIIYIPIIEAKKESIMLEEKHLGGLHKVSRGSVSCLLHSYSFLDTFGFLHRVHVIGDVSSVSEPFF